MRSSPLLRAHKEILAERFGVADLALFGSFARDRAGDDSDVDILVRFDGRATSKRYFDTQFHIEDLLGRPVDLVTDGTLRRELHPYVEREASMSLREREKREWRICIKCMDGLHERFRDYTAGLDQAVFIAGPCLTTPPYCKLELIGEAATPQPGHRPDASD